MSDPDKLPQLRMTATETAQDLARRIERERRAQHRQLESDLETGLGEFRVGTVPYFNSVPLIRGIEEHVTLHTPAVLAEKMRNGDLDAALLSTIEVLHRGDYDILDGIGISSLGEVYSVILIHEKPVEELEAVYCDPASLSSLSLLRVLLAERGLKPELRTLESYEAAAGLDGVLLIGNPAIDFRRAHPDRQVWDLGAAWYELTHLPFVFAVWALRRDKDTTTLRRKLREARDFGVDTLDYIIGERKDYDLDFRKDYLGWHIHYHLGDDEHCGIERFRELLETHGLGPAHPPRYVA